jgi:hypothetical protein
MCCVDLGLAVDRSARLRLVRLLRLDARERRQETKVAVGLLGVRGAGRQPRSSTCLTRLAVSVLRRVVHDGEHEDAVTV